MLNSKLNHLHVCTTQTRVTIRNRFVNNVRIRVRTENGEEVGRRSGKSVCVFDAQMIGRKSFYLWLGIAHKMVKKC